MENYNKIKEEIKEMIKDVIMNDDDIHEYDLLYKNKKNWSKAKNELRSDLVNLMKHLEGDEYKKGSMVIDKVIDNLKRWKKKINKHLD